MADMLTSVRLNEEVLDSLRLFATAHGTSVAAEIRTAIDDYVARVKKSPELKTQLKEQIREREQLIDRLLATG